jgi:quercetin dioxygenase-like cupin family protein
MKSPDTRRGDATVLDESRAEPGRASRREFLGLGSSTLAAVAIVSGEPFLNGSYLMAAEPSDQKKSMMTMVSKDSTTVVGEPLNYLSTPDPEISSGIVTIPAGTTTEWMTHPVQGFLYVLEGTLTVEYADGPRKVFKAGQGFPQARSKWHRGRNDGETLVRFLAVFYGGKDVPNVLHPPASP